MKSAIGIPLSQHERNEVFENDKDAYNRGVHALGMVRCGRITRGQFIRLIDAYRGEALARFARECAAIAQNRINEGWEAVNARAVSNGV